jgi:hypothetical protein
MSRSVSNNTIRKIINVTYSCRYVNIYGIINTTETIVAGYKIGYFPGLEPTTYISTRPNREMQKISV